MDIKDVYKRIRAIDENQSVEECGIMPMPSMPGQQDNVSMNLSMNANGAGGIRDLMGILRNIEHGENPATDAGDHSELDALFGEPETKDADVLLGAEPEMDETYGNSMQGASGKTDYDVATVTDMGSNDGRGDHEARKVNGGGNPMRESLVDRLSELYQEVKSRDSNKALNEFDVSLMQPTNANTNRMFGAHIAGTPEVKAIVAQMEPADYVETNKFKQQYPSADTYLEKNKWRDVVMGRQHQDMYNFVQRYNRDNNNLSIAQWLEKAKNSIKGAVTGQPAEPVSYDAARFDPNARGYGQDVTKPEKAFPMKESNEIVKLSKMLNG